jgi:hypothetical protein
VTYFPSCFAPQPYLFLPFHSSRSFTDRRRSVNQETRTKERGTRDGRRQATTTVRATSPNVSARDGTRPRLPPQPSAPRRRRCPTASALGCRRVHTRLRSPPHCVRVRPRQVAPPCPRQAASSRPMKLTTAGSSARASAVVSVLFAMFHWSGSRASS